MKKKQEIKQKTQWNKRQSVSKGVDVIIHIIGYAIVLFLVSQLFKKTVFISNFWYGVLAVTIVLILNKTVKPVLTWLTIPLTAMS